MKFEKVIIFLFLAIVNPIAAQISISNPPTSVCSNEDTINLTTVFSPAGGIISGSGVVDATALKYLPSLASSAIDTVSYTYTDSLNFTLDTFIVINILPSSTLVVNDSIRFCANAVSTNLNNVPGTGNLVSPLGGIYKGTGITQNSIFNPQLVAVGVNPIMYIYENPQGCSDSLNLDIIIDSLPNVNIDLFPNICFGDSLLKLTQGKPFGGVYTAIIPNLIIGNDTLNPQASGIPSNAVPIEYIFTDSNSCTGSAQRFLEISPLPQVNFSNPGGRCFDSTAQVFTINTVSPTAGFFSGSGVDSSGNFDLSNAPGIYTINYTYTDSSGCSSSATNNFQVFALSSLTFPPLNDVCINANPFQLNNATPLGGNYSGSNVVNNIFYPQNASAGVDTIQYIFTDFNNCSNVIEQTITINALPTVAFSLGDSICNNAPIDTVNIGAPSGGLYSGNGIDALTAAFNPLGSSGLRNLTYTYTDPITSCVNSASTTRYVSQAPNASFGSIPPICESVPAFQITTAGPSGGTFSGLGVNLQGVFDPSVQSGGRTITYTIANSLGCADSATQNIFVNPSPIVNFAPLPAVCENGNAIPLSGGSPAGGFYTGGAVLGNFFNPSLSQVGFDSVTYVYQDINGCPNSATQQIIVNPRPNVSIDTFPPLCDNSPAYQLKEGQPQGGFYSGNTVNSAGFFNPLLLVSGDYTITYTYIDSNNCSNSTNRDISILPLPNISFGPLPDLCYNSDSVNVKLAQPSGGIYSGASGFNSITGYFNPLVSGVGGFDITYTLSDTIDTFVCTNTATATVFVNQIPQLRFSLSDNNICSGFEVTITANGGLDYQWNSGDTTNEIIQKPRISTTYIITASNSVGCTSEDSVRVSVLSNLDLKAERDSITTTLNTNVDLDIVANDIGNINEAQILEGPFNGELDGAFNPLFTYKPNPGFRRTDSVTYQVCDQKCSDVCDTNVWIIKVFGDTREFIPNGFSPNGDGVNDVFIIPGIELFQDNEFIVLNRSGEPVFKAKPYQNDWSGNINAGFLNPGQKVTDGTYFYILRLDNTSDPLTGYIEVKSR